MTWFLVGVLFLIAAIAVGVWIEKGAEPDTNSYAEPWQ